MTKKALEGVRIADLSIVWSGPIATRYLAEMGAEVIKVEYAPAAVERLAKSGSIQGTSSKKLADERAERARKGELLWKRQGYVLQFHAQKKAITLDIENPKGKEIFKRLVQTSDVVMENFRARATTNLGIDYPVIKEWKPDIIMCSMPGFGKTGPEKDYLAWGTIIEQLAGLTGITGYLDEVPHRAGIFFGDQVAGTVCAAAIMAALIYRNRTGKGQYIDISQAESVTSLIGEVIMDYAMNQRAQKPMGNRDHSMAPQGAYPTKAKDRWIAISIASDEEWQRFRQIMGNPDWAADQKYSTLLGRWQNHDELDKLIGGWTVQHDRYELMETLQKAGIAAGVVADIEELITKNPQNQARKIYSHIPHPDGVTYPIPRMTWQLSKTPGVFDKYFPDEGNDNDYVYGELLGMPKEEREALAREGII
jgi:crotonobetainyl-CoA:carnitine CoA-transferase CaiB-like acyl-CoA transferase